MKRFKVIFAVVLTFVFLSNAFPQTPIKLNLTGGVNTPLGDFAEQYKMGLSIEGGVFYSIPMAPIDLTLTAGYNSFTYKNEYFTNLVTAKLGVGVANFNPTWTATDIPIMVGARYTIPSPGYSPYIWGEAGLHLLSFKDRLTGRITGNTSNPTTLSWSGNTESGSETVFGYAIGAGVTIPIAPKIGLDLNVKYNGNSAIYSKAFEVFRNSNSNFTNPEMKNMSFITARAGILITL